MQKLYCKRAKDYHSSDEEEDPEEAHNEPAAAGGQEDPVASSGSDGKTVVDADAQSDDELGEDVPHQGITKLAEGSRAFKLVFSKIMKKKLPNEPLGPVLSVHKSLVAEKLAEDATEHKAKAETKRLKFLAHEKWHVILASFLDAKEKHLISVATKGVVKLFNVVSKAQVTQKRLDSAKSKDAKGIYLPIVSQYSGPVISFIENFDFAAMNEKFKKDEVWGELGNVKASSSNKEGEAKGIGHDKPKQNNTRAPKIDVKNGEAVEVRLGVIEQNRCIIR